MRLERCCAGFAAATAQTLPNTQFEHQHAMPPKRPRTQIRSEKNAKKARATAATVAGDEHELAVAVCHGPVDSRIALPQELVAEATRTILDVFVAKFDELSRQIRQSQVHWQESAIQKLDATLQEIHGTRRAIANRPSGAVIDVDAEEKVKMRGSVVKVTEFMKRNWRWREVDVKSFLVQFSTLLKSRVVKNRRPNPKKGGPLSATIRVLVATLKPSDGVKLSDCCRVLRRDGVHERGSPRNGRGIRRDGPYDYGEAQGLDWQERS